MSGTTRTVRRRSPFALRRVRALLGALAPLIYIYLGWVLVLSLAGVEPAETWTLALFYVLASVIGPLAYGPDLFPLLYVVASVYVLLALGTRFGDLPWWAHALCASVWYLAPVPLHVVGLAPLIT